ncbi:MAG: MlaD family protein [Thermodesulfobacteriota bacterium]
MKDYGSIYIKVGLFVFFTILIFFIGIFIISGEQKFFEKEYVVKTYFNNTAGLLPGAYVRLSGVRIGSVSKIDFPNNINQSLIEVSMKINKQGADRITPDSQATIRTEGLLGAKYIEIVRGEEPPFADINQEMTVNSYTPPELQELIGSSDELLTNLIKISKNLDKVSSVFGDEENLENISQTLSSLRIGSDALQKNLTAIEKGNGILHTLIYDKKFNQEFSTTIANLSETSANFRDISESLKGGEGTLGALLIDPSIHDSLKGVLGEAQRSKFIRAAVQYLVESDSQDTKSN